MIRCVPFFFAFTVWGLGAWGLFRDWRFQVTLFRGWFLLPGLPWIPPLQLMDSVPC